jgi:hypothetical protein
MKRVRLFFIHNNYKSLYFKAIFLSGFYRLCILILPMKKLQENMGISNEESLPEGTEEQYREAARISHVVERVSKMTPWESKCLVKALTAQHLLRKRRIPSTLYLGVGKNNNDMIAHAWLRSGKCYITGGNGEGYAPVAKFRS